MPNIEKSPRYVTRNLQADENYHYTYRGFTCLLSRDKLYKRWTITQERSDGTLWTMQFRTFERADQWARDMLRNQAGVK